MIANSGAPGRVHRFIGGFMIGPSMDEGGAAHQPMRRQIIAPSYPRAKEAPTKRSGSEVCLEDHEVVQVNVTVAVEIGPIIDQW